MGRAGLRADRLSFGDWCNGAGSLALIVILFAVPWFRARGLFSEDLGERRVYTYSLHVAQRATTGWSDLGWIGPFVLFVCCLGLIVFLTAATRRSPAVPVAVSIVQAPFAFAAFVALLIRVLFERPGAVSPALGGVGRMLPMFRALGFGHVTALAGGYIGLLLSLMILVGIYLSLRRDAVAIGDAPKEIETIDVSGATGPGDGAPSAGPA